MHPQRILGYEHPGGLGRAQLLEQVSRAAVPCREPVGGGPRQGTADRAQAQAADRARWLAQPLGGGGE